MLTKSLVFATVMSGVAVLGAPLAPTPTDVGGGNHHSVSINCVENNGENTGSPSQSAAVNEALVSILPAVEGKTGWTVDCHDDGKVESLTIEGHNEAADASEEDKGGVGALEFWDWFGTWRYDYAYGIGPKK